MNVRDRHWSCFHYRYVLRTEEDRLVRKVVLNCFQPSKESEGGDIPNLEVGKLYTLCEMEKRVKIIRPLRLCQPLHGDTAK